MKISFFYAIVCAGIMALSSCGSSGHEGHDHDAVETTAQVQYTCPMHPEIVQNEPGDCPKCNMKLEKKGAEMDMEESH